MIIYSRLLWDYANVFNRSLASKGIASFFYKKIQDILLVDPRFPVHVSKGVVLAGNGVVFAGNGVVLAGNGVVLAGNGFILAGNSLVLTENPAMKI